MPFTIDANTVLSIIGPLVSGFILYYVKQGQKDVKELISRVGTLEGTLGGLKEKTDDFKKDFRLHKEHCNEKFSDLFNLTRAKPAIEQAIETHNKHGEKEGQHILVVDDNKELARIYSELYKLSGYTHTMAHSYDGALDALNKSHFDCALIDIVLNSGIGKSGVDLHNAIKMLYKDKIKIIVCSGYTPPKMDPHIRYVDKGQPEKLINKTIEMYENW